MNVKRNIVRYRFLSLLLTIFSDLLLVFKYLKSDNLATDMKKSQKCLLRPIFMIKWSFFSTPSYLTETLLQPRRLLQIWGPQSKGQFVF